LISWTLLGFAAAVGLIILLSPYFPERAYGDGGPVTTAGSNDASGASCGDAGGGGDGGGSCD
jgi:hypothetical protein